jgi:hypothetical protein
MLWNVPWAVGRDTPRGAAGYHAIFHGPIFLTAGANHRNIRSAGLRTPVGPRLSTWSSGRALSGTPSSARRDVSLMLDEARRQMARQVDFHGGRQFVAVDLPLKARRALVAIQ